MPNKAILYLLIVGLTFTVLGRVLYVVNQGYELAEKLKKLPAPALAAPPPASPPAPADIRTGALPERPARKPPPPRPKPQAEPSLLKQFDDWILGLFGLRVATPEERD